MKNLHQLTRHSRFRYAPPILLTQHRLCRNVRRHLFFLLFSNFTFNKENKFDFYFFKRGEYCVPPYARRDDLDKKPFILAQRIA